MLDNFGMGEFLMLALFALLFFGPERLPQIGAQLGKWLSKLTSYSKAFMNQWTEEAAAVQGAVQDVMMIRDEIRAAQAEIAESLTAAQQDINETISVAKGTIQAATPTADGFTQAATPALANAEDANRFKSSPSPSSSKDDGEAVSKTQDIVNSLLAKQDTHQEGEEAEEEAPAPSTATDEDEAYQKNLAAIQEIMGRSTKSAPEQAEPSSEEAPVEETAQEETTAAPDEAAQAAVAPSGGLFDGSVTVGQVAESESKREEQESPFEKTQAILNKLMGIEPEAEPEPKPEPEPELTLSPESPEPAEAPVAEATTGTEATVETKAQDMTDASAATEPPAAAQAVTADDTPAAEPPAPVSAKTSAVQHVRGPDNGVSMSDFSKLSIEVNLLKRELRTLRKELQALHTEEPKQQGDSSSAMAVEEVA
jgi:Sec-independent protein translocase protein TatA